MGIVNYFKETKGEMKHVSWPTRKQSVNFTLLVIAISIVTALILGFFDFFFSLGLEKTIGSDSYRGESATTNGSPIPSDATSTVDGAEAKFQLDL